MKKWLLELAATLAVASIYSAWQYRSQVWELIDDEVLDQARYRRAIEQTLRSIRRLPETKEDS